MSDLSFKSIDLNQEKLVGFLNSKKAYPIFEIDNEKYLYKPLSLTKPYVTDISLFGEVYWSFILQKYFDKRIPLARLAYFDNQKLKQKQDCYFNRGTLVKYFLKEDENLIDVIEYFKNHPDNYFESNTYLKSKIFNYTNYVQEYYDYSYFFETDLIKSNKNLGSTLAYQILLSLLRADQNFHYGNVGFIEKNKSIHFHPPIDFEFSNIFMYTDIDSRNYWNYHTYKDYFPRDEEWHNEVDRILKIDELIDLHYVPANQRNLFYIIKNYPNVINYFMKQLDEYKKDINKYIITDDQNFIKYYFTSHHNFYLDMDDEKWHQQNMEQLNKYVLEFDKSIVKEDLLKWINIDLKKNLLRFEVFIKLYVYLNNLGYDKLDELTIEKVGEILNINFDYKNINNDKYYKKILKIIDK